ncbi:hypothetical protein UPYG_G00069590 [Umbra pygmaea]|uniref:Mif2/CENP-C cupin domain-containing protein n=1 Tax=Umbra pygmaea TaxID=75934 RepID=A0ABD0XVZ2_UMBPY
MSGAGEYLRKLLCFANSSYCLAMEPKKLVCCRKRLRYLVNKDGPSTTKGNAELDINDSNTWFKDLDSPLGKELLSFSPVEEKPKKNKSEGKPSPFPLKNGTETPGHDVGPRAEKMQPESREEHSHQYNEVESLFQEDCPIKTSSPIELGPEHRVTAVSRLLFNSDDGNDDEDQNHNKRPVSTQEQKFNDQEADMYNNVELDSAPWMYSLIKQETPTIISKEESPVRKLNLSLCSTDVESEGPNQSSPSLVVEPKEQPVPEQKTVVQPPPKKPGVQLPKKTTGFHPPKTMTEVQVPEKMSGVQPPGKTTQNHERKNFRQMLREAGFPKLAGKPLVFPVRKPPSINLEDEFQILEDDSPFRFSLCRKPNPNRTTSIPQLKPLDQSQSSDHTSAGTLAHASQSETATTRYRAKGEEIVRPSAAGHVGKKSKGQTVNRGSSNTPAHDKSSPKKWTSSTVQEAPPAGDAPVSNVDHKAELREQDKRTGRKKEKLSGPIGEEPVTTLEERKAVEEEHRGVEEKHRGVAEPCHQGAVDQEAPLSGNRRRRKPETWWLVDTDTQDTQTHNTHTTNKSNHNRDKPTTNPARQKAELKKRLSKSSSNQNTEKKAARWSRLQKMSREETERPESEEEEEEEVEEEMEVVPLSPVNSPLRRNPQITKAPSDMDDDFQILEDDSPFRFSLCRKPNPNRTTSIPQLKPLEQSQSSDHTSAGTLAHASQSEIATTRYRAKGEEIVRPPTAGHVGKMSKGQTVNRGSSNTPAHDKSSPKKWSSFTVQEAPPTGDAPVSNVDHKAELREQDKRKGRKKEKLLDPIGEEPVTTLEERKAVEEEYRGVAEPCHQGAVDQDAPLSGKRRRRKPEPWWLVDTDTQDTQTHNTHTTNKSNHYRDKPTTNPARQKAELKKRLSKYSSNQNTEKKAARWSRLQKMSREETERPESEEEEVLLSPMASPLRQHRHITTEKVFDWLYTRTPQSKLPQSDVTPRRQTHLAQDAQQKPARRSTAPGNCQKTSNSEDISRSSSASHPREPPHNPKTRKVERRKTKPAPSQTQPVNSSFIPWSGAAPPVATVRSTPQVSGQKPWSPEESPGSCGSAEEPVQNLASDRSPSPMDLSCQRVNIEPAVLVGGQLGTENPQNRDFYRRSNRLSDNTLRAFKSGPSSMIELEDYEDNEEDICLPSSLVMPYQSTQLKQAAVEELCGPPLKTITLQAEDSANLKEWLSLLWPVSGKLGSQISPDDFQWFAYRGRALGCRMDLQAGTFCSGKLLLGSYLKKPLIVDHNATTVYNLLTSFVSVTINGQKTHYNPGQTFMVECGHAYSLHNLTQEPAALHFTRILVESSD